MIDIRRIAQGLLVLAVLGWVGGIVPLLWVGAIGGTCLLVTAATGRMGLGHGGNALLATTAALVGWVLGTMSGYLTLIILFAVAVSAKALTPAPGGEGT